MTRASAGPSPKTVCVAYLYRSHPLHSLADSRSVRRVIFAGKNASAVGYSGNAGMADLRISSQPNRKTPAAPTGILPLLRLPLSNVFHQRRNAGIFLPVRGEG